MYIDYSRKRDPSSDGMYKIAIRIPGLWAGKSSTRYVDVNICNTCKTILGTGTDS